MSEEGGHFGFWTVEGPNLDLLAVSGLQEGVEVEIVWSGGNGPHRYVIAVDDNGRRYAVSVHQDIQGPFRYYNPLDWFIGDHPRTQVRRA